MEGSVRPVLSEAADSAGVFLEMDFNFREITMPSLRQAICQYAHEKKPMLAVVEPIREEGKTVNIPKEVRGIPKLSNEKCRDLPGSREEHPSKDRMWKNENSLRA
jgi:hypothetical protein